jgi:uncharacterized protein YbjT (DUF2867 family)
MHIILGGNGHVGSAVAHALLSQGEPVTVVSRSSTSIPEWQKRGAQVEVVDVRHTTALHRVFAKGKRLFLLNPPADPAAHIDVEERKSLVSILSAIEHSGLEKIVAQSTYGAQPGDQIGDLGVLYEMEQHLAVQSIPFSVIRAAYYMSNWDFSLQTAKQEGVVHTLFPADFVLPMVTPRDIGELAAQLMTEPVKNVGLHYIEGPERYAAIDVAAAFSRVLQKLVKAVETSSEQWMQTLQGMGFSNAAATSFSNMTALTLAEEMPARHCVTRAAISLEHYIETMVMESIANDEK